MNAKKITPFIILSSQRTGSTFIRIWLNKHSKIHCYGETFLGYYQPVDGFRYFCQKNLYSNIYFKFQHAYINKHLKLNFIPRQYISSYIDDLYFSDDFPAPWTDIKNRVNEPGCRIFKPVVGFKLMYNNLVQYPHLAQWLLEKQPRILHITRSNLLRSYVSMKRMEITRVDHSENSDFKSEKIHINPKKFIQYANSQINVINAYRNKFNINNRFLELTYENFFKENSESKSLILDFLDLEQEDMPFPNMKKIGSSELKDDILNWDELYKALAKTKLAKYLD